MNLKTKKIISSLLIAANLAIPANITLAKEESKTHQEVKVYFNDEQIEFDQQPIIVDGRTKVPFRAIFETMGTVVYYRDSDKSIIGLSRDGDVIKHIVGTNKATINGVEKTYDSISEIRNYRTLIPVRMVADLLNAEVEWDGKNQEVEIEKNIVTNDYHKKIKGILECTLDQNFNPEDFKRYLDYQYNNWSMDPKQVILDVNMDLDRELVEREFVKLEMGSGKMHEISVGNLYLPKEEDITIVKDTENNLVLVNKFNVLPYDYKPENLYDTGNIVKNKTALLLDGGMPWDSKFLKEEAYLNFLEFDKAFSENQNKEYGFYMMGACFYNQYNIDKITSISLSYINSMHADMSIDDRMKYVSGSIYNDLQTGLSFCIELGTINDTEIARLKRRLGYSLTDDDKFFLNLSDLDYERRYKWLIENAYRFGFVLRYPEDKEHITRTLGNYYCYRYVGKEVAKLMYDENLCLEEYWAKYLNPSEYKTDKDSVKKKILERY